MTLRGLSPDLETHDPAMQKQWMQGGFDAAVDSGRAARVRFEETGVPT